MIIDLDDVEDNVSDAVITLQMLVELHNEPHRRWYATQNASGAWDYSKAP